MNVLSLVGGWKGYALVAVAAFAMGWAVRDWKAGREDADRAEAKVKTVERVVYRERQQADVTSEVEAKAVETQVQIRTVTKTIIERVVEYVPLQADDRCVVPVGAVLLLNAAASGDPLPEPSGESDGGAAASAPSGLALSGVVEAVVENYGAANEARANLIALQGWIRQQQAVTNAP